MAHSTLTPMVPDMPEFGRWLQGQSPGHGYVKATVLHHTWSPNSTQFHGRDTIVGIRRFHMETRGFKDIAANAYACPNGTVITGRPLTESNWAHALISRKHVEAEALALAGGNKQFYNYYGFGLEVVANFDEEPIHSGPSGVSYETQAIDPPGDRLASMPRGVRDRATQENTNVHPAQLGLRPLRLSGAGELEEDEGPCQASRGAWLGSSAFRWQDDRRR